MKYRIIATEKSLRPGIEPKLDGLDLESLRAFSHNFNPHAFTEKAVIDCIEKNGYYKVEKLIE